MKYHLTALAVLAFAASVAACDDGADYDDAPPPPPVVEEPMAPSAEDVAAEAAAEAPAPSPPVDALPPDERSSEETVQPESETLFY